MKKKYYQKVDLNVKIITTIMVLIIALIFKTLLTDITNAKLMGLSILSISIFFAIASFPIYYMVDGNEVIIRKIISKKSIKLTSIEKIIKLNNAISFTYSSKGFLGYLGKTMDGSTSYSSSLRNNLLIKTKNSSNFVISPEKIDEFYSEITAYNIEQEV